MLNFFDADTLQWGEILDLLKSRTRTKGGLDAAVNISPLSAHDAQQRIEKIDEIKSLRIDNLRPDFTGAEDVSKLLNLASKGVVLGLEELFIIRESVSCCENIRRFFISYHERAPLCHTDVMEMDNLAEAKKTFTLSITDNQELNAAAYPEIDKLTEAINKQKEEIIKRIGRIIHNPSLDDVIQEKIHDVRNGRYVILIKASSRGRLRGTVHDISSSGATLYFEPEDLFDQNESLLTKKILLEEKIYEALKDLSAYAASLKENLAKNLPLLFQFDLINAASDLSLFLKANKVEISEEDKLVLYNAKHPLLCAKTDFNVIGNDITLGKDYNCMVITGANTGGKTVLLKTVGLCTLMALHGLHVTASPDSVIGSFNQILADIGDDQNLSESLSTFSGQIVKINRILDTADGRTLILMDEFVSGTNPHYGSALARAILERLVTTGAKCIVTTHYPELKHLPTSDKRFINASVSFDIETLKPTYILRTGIPGLSYTFEIADIYKLDKTVIEKARSLADSAELTLESLIAKVQSYETELMMEKDLTERLKRDLLKERETVNDLKLKLKDEIRNAREYKGIEFIDDLTAYKKKINDQIKDISTKSIREAEALKIEIASKDEEISAKLREYKRERFIENYRSFDSDTAVAGSKVFVISLEKEGKIESIDKNKKSASILLGNSFKAKFSFDDLLMIPGEKKSKEKKNDIKIVSSVNKDGIIPITIQTSLNTIDLRGKRVDDALNILDNDLDRMFREGISSAVIIHGHGTGALKEAVRNQIKFSRYIANYRQGEQGEGGDGVTIVLINS